MIKKLVKKLIKNFQDEKKRMIGLSHLLNIRNKYINITSLNDVDYKIFSQNGEDGIIDYILYSLQIKKPKFIEIGVGDYNESNTRFIFETRSLKGMVIDCISNLKILFFLTDTFCLLLNILIILFGELTFQPILLIFLK